MKQYLIMAVVAMVACVAIDYVLPLKQTEDGNLRRI